jgi:hypothetical protein
VQAPIKLAIFDFELEDFSASSTRENPSAAQLASVTGEVRQLLTQSGRYRLVDVRQCGRGGSEGAHAARVQWLRCRPSPCNSALSNPLSVS